MGITRTSEEIKESGKRLEFVRQNYKESIKEYDFLNELDQIANVHYNNSQKTLEMSVVEDHTLLNISVISIHIYIIKMVEDAKPQ